MRSKYLNDAIIGNNKIVASFSSKGEMLRLFYGARDYKQFIDCIYTGIKVNDSAIIYLHEDINNEYEQYYTDDTNILNTKIKNTYFNLSILQTDFVSISKDILIKKYKLTNENSIDLNVNFLMYSRLLSNDNNMVGTKIEKDIFMQYSHDYTFNIFSKLPILNYRLNNSKEEIKSGLLYDKDYIGMAEDSAFSLDVGILKPGESREFEIFIYINDNKKKYKFDEIIEDVEKIKKINVKKELEETEEYWKKYIINHDGLKIFSKQKEWEKKISGQNVLSEYTRKEYEKMKKIYTRSILLFPLLLNSETGGISAAIEVDENRDKSGRYSYCWPRDAVFVTKALDILEMKEETTKFYTKFCINTQSENGMWEQRFYTDGRLAPCWGYQIDETASIVYGVYEHYKIIKDKKFLKQTYEMCKKAIKSLEFYLETFSNGDSVYFEKIPMGIPLGTFPNGVCVPFGNNNIKNIEKDIKFYKTHESYDLWEMNEGIHLYSLSAIYAAFNAMYKIEKELNEEVDTLELEEYERKTKEYCLNNFINKIDNTLKRNNKDDVVDISVLGSVVPFSMLNENKKEIENTIEKIDLTLKTYTGGYLRFQNDSYMGGNNPWPVATLWMTLYNLKNKSIEDAVKQIEFVTNTATQHGFLAEQVDNETMKSKWVIGLGWSHAMYILVLLYLNSYWDSNWGRFLMGNLSPMGIKSILS